MRKLTQEELATYWRIDSIRCLKNCVSTLELYAYQVGQEDPIMGRHYRALADRVEAILDEFREGEE